MTSDAACTKLPPKHILIAEDDSTAAYSLRLALLANGHSVEIASSAEQALALFEAGVYDLLITDFKLPGMDGLELAEAIKKYDRNCPVILVTAYAETVQSATGKVSNVDLLLGKPVSLAQVQDALRRVFQTSPLRAA